MNNTYERLPRFGVNNHEKRVTTFSEGWIEYNSKDVLVLKKELSEPHENLLCALEAQANSIGDNVAMMVSGGIDSQAAALGFSRTNLDVEYVFFKTIFEDSWNELEWLYASSFFKKYKIKPKVIDVELTKRGLQDKLIEWDFFTNSLGLGTLIQYMCYEKYATLSDRVPVSGDGHLVFENKDGLCSGIFSGGVHQKYVNNIMFTLYAKHLPTYYKHKHQKELELQIPEKYEAKNIIYQELGFHLRPKLSGWEFLDKSNDYKKLNMIDFSSDHGEKARYCTGEECIVDVLSINNKYLDMRKQYKKESMERAKDKTQTLYTFSSNMDNYYEH